MALAATVFQDFNDSGVASGDLTTTSRTFNAGELIVVCYVNEGNTNPTNVLTIVNSATAQTWTPRGNAANTAATDNCQVNIWSCVMSVTQAMTISITGTSGSLRDALIWTIQNSGQNATTPIPAGNVFSGASGHNVSQSITPTSVGSDLWMVAGDFGATNTFAAIGGCTLDQLHNSAGAATFALIRPSTQPLTSTSPVTLGETDTGGTIAWVAFEIQSTGAPTINTQPQNQAVYAGQTATFTIAATTSAGTLHYQWKNDGINVGTDSTTYAPTVAVSDDQSLINCVVSDDNGSTTSDTAILTVYGTAAIAWFGF